MVFILKKMIIFELLLEESCGNAMGPVAGNGLTKDRTGIRRCGGCFRFSYGYGLWLRLWQIRALQSSSEELWWIVSLISVTPPRACFAPSDVPGVPAASNNKLSMDQHSYMAFKCSATTLLLVKLFKLVTFSVFKTSGIIGFLPKTKKCGEKP